MHNSGVVELDKRVRCIAWVYALNRHAKLKQTIISSLPNSSTALSMTAFTSASFPTSTFTAIVRTFG
jgi:hypothetical protein